MTSPVADQWALDPAVTQLNHGSFGACPKPVLEAQQRVRAQMERQPSGFFIRERQGLLEKSRAALARLVRAEPADLAFVRNATTAVNDVLRSIPWKPGDEILTTNHAYGACRNAAAFVAERHGVKLVTVTLPFPLEGPDVVVDRVVGAVTDRTRLAMLDHVTSPTALIFPLEKIVPALNTRGVDTLVDGAHAVGMLDLDLPRLGASWYTSNCHKWLCAPKGAAFLWTRPDRQAMTRPTVISHGASATLKGRTLYQEEFDWTGTDDPTPWICIADAIEFCEGVVPGGLAGLRRYNRGLVIGGRRGLCEALSVEAPCPEEMLGSIASVVLPDSGEVDSADVPWPEPVLRLKLIREHGIEVPVFFWPASPRRLLRISAQAYNAPEDYERLAAALKQVGG